jgi:rod shape-determining protein MreC
LIGLLKRYRELLLVVVLLVVPLGVYFAHAKHPSERSSLDRIVLALSGPLEKAVGWAVTGVARGWYGYVDLRRAGQRALELQQRVNRLELDRLELERIRGERERLVRLLHFAAETPDRTVIGARVVGVRLDPKGLQLLTLDRGARDGLARMMPVVAAGGVVGRIHGVGSSTSDVLLLSDRNSSIAVRVERSRARANVRGAGSPDVARLEYALRSDDMSEGDLLVTSGTDGVFPRGLPVGRIAGLKRSGQGLYQRADVVPVVDVTKVEEVLVLSAFERGPEEAPAAAVAAPAAAVAPSRGATP